MRSRDRIIFDALLLIFFVAMVVIAFQYNPRARSIPQLVGSITALLVFLQLVYDAFPGTRKLLHILEDRGAFSAPAPQEKDKAGASAEQPRRKESWGEALRLILWLLFFLVIFRYVDYRLSIPVFVFLIMRFQGKVSWRGSLGVAIGTGAFITILFDVVLRTSL